RRSRRGFSAVAARPLESAPARHATHDLTAEPEDAGRDPAGDIARDVVQAAEAGDVREEVAKTPHLLELRNEERPVFREGKLVDELGAERIDDDDERIQVHDAVDEHAPSVAALVEVDGDLNDAERKPDDGVKPLEPGPDLPKAAPSNRRVEKNDVGS